jgi:hypothetical protein
MPQQDEPQRHRDAEKLRKGPRLNGEALNLQRENGLKNLRQLVLSVPLCLCGFLLRCLAHPQAAKGRPRTVAA